MANREIKKVPINGDALRDEIKKAGYSIRGIAKFVCRSDRQIRYYLERNEMPEYLLDDIRDALHPRTKKLWIRLGGYVWVSDDELYNIMQRCHEDHLAIHGKWARPDGMEDYDADESEAKDFLKYFTADGETYIPDVCFDEHLDWWMKKKEEMENA